MLITHLQAQRPVEILNFPLAGLPTFLEKVMVWNGICFSSDVQEISVI